MLKRSGWHYTSKRCGVAALETALLIPLIFLMLVYGLQIAFILLSHQTTQYAAYMSARAQLVYGDKTLAAINYPHSANALGSGDSSGLLTSGDQSIAEAAAEKILFESLPWEHRRIEINDPTDLLSRTYRDGIDSVETVNNGSVRIEFVRAAAAQGLPGTKITYCMPVLFPGLQTFFTGNFSSTKGETNPCDNVRDGMAGHIPISHEFFLGREP